MLSLNERQHMEPIPENLAEVEQYMKDRVGLDETFDFGVRKLKILNRDVHIYYVNGLIDTLFVLRILEELVHINETRTESKTKNIFELIENRINNQSVETVSTLDEVVDQVLSGLIAIFVDGEEKAFVVDTRSYPGRQPEEPDTEKVVRGSRDGFVENIINNTALIRRRIRDARFVLK